ncbi:hypothetical protein CNY89_20345, partial [Amaricoccus sp. HAR-UPW-R2A-40]
MRRLTALLGDILTFARAARGDHQVPATPAAPDPDPAFAAPILAEVRAFGTEYDALLRPCCRRFTDALYEPVLQCETRMHEHALRGQRLSNELVALVPDLVRAALRAHPLTVAQAG